MTRLSIEESKVALRDVEISNVDYPKKLLVDFSKASVKYVYDRVNGENVATTDEVKQIILHGKNAVVASKLKSDWIQLPCKTLRFTSWKILKRPSIELKKRSSQKLNSPNLR